MKPRTILALCLASLALGALGGAILGAQLAGGLPDALAAIRAALAPAKPAVEVQLAPGQTTEGRELPWGAR